MTVRGSPETGGYDLVVGWRQATHWLASRENIPRVTSEPTPPLGVGVCADAECDGCYTRHGTTARQRAGQLDGSVPQPAGVGWHRPPDVRDASTGTGACTYAGACGGVADHVGPRHGHAAAVRVGPPARGGEASFSGGRTFHVRPDAADRRLDG